MTDLVTPQTLRAHWPAIRAGLDAVQAKAPEDWIAEDVYHAIKAGTAACYLDGDGSLLILLRREAEFTGAAVCHVWIGYSAGGGDVFATGLDLIRQCARAMGATGITFGSPRLGWAKRFPLISATYAIPLEAG